MDKRRTYYLTIDTETANGLEDPMVYDIGGAIHDRKGIVYETFSFVVSDIFNGMADLMQSAYYANKLPNYRKELENGTRELKSLYECKKHIHEICEQYHVVAIIAHNARFDYNSLTKTERYLTKSKYRFFLPYGIEVWDTMKMAKDVFGHNSRYISFCQKNGYMTKHRTPRPQMKAETIYKYLTKDTDFTESHTGLEDVLIEKEIFAFCMRQRTLSHKKLWEDPIEKPKPKKMTYLEKVMALL